MRALISVMLVAVMPALTKAAMAQPTDMAAAPAEPGIPSMPPAPDAADTVTADEKEEARKAVVGYTVPDAPALTALSAGTATIERPGNTTSVAAALVNLVTPDGRIRTGSAFEVNLRALGYRPTTNEYATNPGARILSRLAFSIATVSEPTTSVDPPTAEQDDSRSVRLGVGARVTLWDQSDPYLLPAYLEAVRRTREICLAIQRVPPGPWEKCRQDSYVEEAKAKDLEPAWNGGGLSLAAAQTFRFDEAKLGEGNVEATQGYVSLALGVGAWGQLNIGGGVAHRYDPSGTDILSAARFRFGGTSVRGTTEFSFSVEDAAGATETTSRVAAGFEARITSGSWIQATAGGDLEDEELFTIGSIKWDILDDPSFDVD